ncbi:MAG: phosphate ABC transporter permease subunit PstC [Thermoplasmatota archaeon]
MELRPKLEAIIGSIRSRLTAESIRDYIFSLADRDNQVRLVLFIVSLAALFTLGMVFYFLFSEALPAFIEIGPIEMLTAIRWNPTSTQNPIYGMVPLMAGTFMVSMVATLIAIPIGMGCTIYIFEIAHPRIRGFLKPMIEILAGVPSVIYGFFALVILASWIDQVFDSTTRLNALNGAVMLAVMMIPIMVSLAEDALNSVPRELREASYAMGATRWETLKGVLIPAALPGITAAIVLSIGRAIGETMTVLMATGNSPVITADILHSMQTMTAAIAIEMGEVAQGSLHYHALFAVGVVLFIFTFILNSIADWLMNKFTEAYQ